MALTRDALIQNLLGENMLRLTQARNANEVSVEEFGRIYPAFFEAVFRTAQADISGIEGFGEFDENHQPSDRTFLDFVQNTFSQDVEGYWYHWREMFECTMLREDFFEEIYARILKYAPYCANQRYLVNGFAFFVAMATNGKQVSFLDWSRAGIMDYLIDFATMDLNKPYLLIPERLAQYAAERGISIPDFRERYLCMAFYRGIDNLRWHASIDDEESCTSIMRYLRELEERIMRIEL